MGGKTEAARMWRSWPIFDKPLAKILVSLTDNSQYSPARFLLISASLSLALRPPRRRRRRRPTDPNVSIEEVYQRAFELVRELRGYLGGT